MSKIPETRVVTKNGKTFTQTYWVSPDKAGAGANAKALGQQPQISANVDFGMSEGAQRALDDTINSFDGHGFGNPEDFANGFDSAFGYATDTANAQKDLMRYLGDNDADEVNQEAFIQGYAAGVVAELGKNDENYVSEIIDKTNLTKTEFDEELKSLRNKVLARNPFEAGMRVAIPAGTPYRVITETGANEVWHISYDDSIKVEALTSPYAHANRKMVFAAPGSIISEPTGDGSSSRPIQVREFFLTPKLISMNDKEILPVGFGNAMERQVRFGN